MKSKVQSLKPKVATLLPARWHARLFFVFAFSAFFVANCFAPPVNFRIMDESGTNVFRTSLRFFSLSNPSQSGTNIFAVRDFVRANTNSPLQVLLNPGRWRVTAGTLSWVITVPNDGDTHEATDLGTENILRLDDETSSGTALILD